MPNAAREFCMRHPQIRDVCDLGQMIFWDKKWAFYFTAVMFILNSKHPQCVARPHH